MKTKIIVITIVCIFSMSFWMCKNPQSQEAAVTVSEAGPGQSSVQDDQSEKNVVQIASESPDHTTLVAAVKAAGLVDVLVNAGPFTVFAPVNKAFDQLPAGTVESLLKPENKRQLQDILEYHVFVGVISEDMVTDGRVLNQVNLKNVTLGNKDGKLTVNDANIIGSVKASNGVIHVIDKVLLPQ
ncbi:MAG: fasciclin domain-containing protein [Saprospiraceae bacterium]|nr:fasciclin domain-containing protein [Saprospiraceae bacterium]